jgi:hypothetical protein
MHAGVDLSKCRVAGSAHAGTIPHLRQRAGTQGVPNLRRRVVLGPGSLGSAENRVENMFPRQQLFYNRGFRPGWVVMQIWVDADACPAVIKGILYRAAERVKCPLVLVANKPLQTPPSPYIKSMQVPGGIDVADNRIIELATSGDLVITADIPLAAAVIAKGAHALNPRGEMYTKDNIRERLAMRNFMGELRNSGVMTGGPTALSHSDRQAFANQLDRFLTRMTGGGKQ